MGWPQIIVIVFFALDLFTEMLMHKKHRVGTYNFWGKFIAIGLFSWILGQGGFWQV